jgi:hypothetical protein
MLAVQSRERADILNLAASFKSSKVLKTLFAMGGASLTNKDKIGRTTSTVLASSGYADYSQNVLAYLQECKTILPLNLDNLRRLPIGNLSNDKIDSYLNNKTEEEEKRARQLIEEGKAAEAERRKEEARIQIENERIRLQKALEKERLLAEEDAKRRAQAE